MIPVPEAAAEDTSTAHFRKDPLKCAILLTHVANVHDDLAQVRLLRILATLGTVCLGWILKTRCAIRMWSRAMRHQRNLRGVAEPEKRTRKRFQP